MKILFCYDGTMQVDNKGNFYPKAFTEEVLNRYLKYGNEMELFCRYRYINENINIYHLSKEILKKVKISNCHNFFSIKGVLYKNLKFKERLEQKIDESDLIIIRLPSCLGNIALDIIKKKNNKRYIVEMVGCPWDALWNHSLKGKIIAPYMYFATKKRIKNADNIIYVTNNFLQRRYPTKGNEIGCSDVFLDKIEEKSINDEIDSIKVKNKEINLATVAAIDIKYKGQQDVIKAISNLNKSGYNLKYKLVGTGKEDRLMKIVKKYNLENSVEFIGSLEHKKVFDFLRKIDIYIQPSKTEGLCRALIEAMSMAKPCIASDAGGNSELISKDFIYKKGDIKALEKTIIRMLDKDNISLAAKENYIKSMDYEREVLDKKKEEFLSNIISREKA